MGNTTPPPAQGDDNRVNIIQAKELKALGYDMPCIAYYVPETDDTLRFGGFGGLPYDMNKVGTTGSDYVGCVSAPTIGEAIKWFYVKYGIMARLMVLNDNDWINYGFYQVNSEGNWFWRGCTQAGKDINEVERFALDQLLSFIPHITPPQCPTA